MNNYGYDNVDITDGFLYQKQKLNEEVTIKSVYDRFYETGRIDAFKMNWKEGMKNKPHFFWDSDVAKWIEGAAYILKKQKNDELSDKIESIIDDIEQNQEENGYFNIYFTVCEPENRFTYRDEHELYCAGHLIEAAVAYYEATGKDRFLKCMEKYTDHIYKIFVEDKSAAFTTPGHEEIEIALLRLYRLTKNEKYLELCKYFIFERGRGEDERQVGDNPSLSDLINYTKSPYDQNHMPVTEQSEAVGHAVRAGYLYTAMADLAYEINDDELKCACKRLFENIVNKKMYITGGIGSVKCGERFSNAYDLPNERAYAETCAAISMILFASKMQKLENKSVYADVIEREIYNGMMSGISVDGRKFFYENPLEINLSSHKRGGSSFDPRKTEDTALAITQRVEVFSCSCCPPNLNRVFASIGNYIFGYDNGVVFVNQFTDCELKDGDVSVSVKTKYPNDGKLEIECAGVKQLAVRIPGWCDKYEISEQYTIKDGYAYITPGVDKVTVEFEMKPVLYEANANVREDYGRAALCCGPFVYCAEGVDNNDELFRLYIDKNLTIRESFDEYFNANVLYVKGYRKPVKNELYAPLNDDFEECEIKMIPYHCFANRDETDMLVFMQYR